MLKLNSVKKSWKVIKNDPQILNYLNLYKDATCIKSLLIRWKNQL